MFSADPAPNWIDAELCHRCRGQFSFFLRKHFCRACGHVFCVSCIPKTTILPKYGIEKEVRVCDTCYDKVNKPSIEAKLAKQDTKLPPEYLKSSLSSLAEQSQEQPKKIDEVLKEEEDFQLARALSISKAEAKEKEKLRVANPLLNNSSKKGALSEVHTSKNKKQNKISPLEQYETSETKQMSNNELQRLVLLKKLRVLDMKEEKLKRQLNDVNKQSALYNNVEQPD